MKERAKAAAVLSLACALHIAGCRTFQYHEPYLHMLQTDSPEVGVRGAIVTIGFSFANMTGKQICGDCDPMLERKVKDEWKTLPVNSLPSCVGLTFERGAIFHTQFEMLASNILEDFRLPSLQGVASIDGVYRLRWRFVEGGDPHSTRARRVSGVSNEFHLLYSAR